MTNGMNPLREVGESMLELLDQVKSVSDQIGLVPGQFANVLQSQELSSQIKGAASMSHFFQFADTHSINVSRRHLRTKSSCAHSRHQCEETALEPQHGPLLRAAMHVLCTKVRLAATGQWIRKCSPRCSPLAEQNGKYLDSSRVDDHIGIGVI